MTLTDIQKLHQSGDLAKAKAAYLEFIETYPTDINALHGLGLLFIEDNDLSQAQYYLEKALTLEPHHPVIVIHLANLYKAKGSLTEAQALLTKMIKQFPDSAVAHNNLGTIHFANQQWQLAKSAFQRAIDARADYVDAYYNLGLTLHQLKEIDAAQSAFSAVLEFDPQHFAARYQLANLALEKYDYVTALSILKLLVDHLPFHFELQCNLALCYLQLNDLSHAQQHYEQAYEMTPADLDVVFNLAVINMQQGRYRRAISYYQEALKLQYDFYPAHHNLAATYLAISQHADALIHFKRAAELQPNSAIDKHMVDVLMQKKDIMISPADYVETLFDRYALNYDQHLVQVLTYQVPALISEVLLAQLSEEIAPLDILDLGCGTGLVGEAVRRAGLNIQSLIGVDLSKNMLTLAEQKNQYDALVVADVFAYLKEHRLSADLIVAADLFPYLGDLSEIFALIRAALKQEGLFIFTVERGEQPRFQLGLMGRFLHHLDYLNQQLLGHGFTVLLQREVVLRTQNRLPVSGYIFLARIVR